MEWFKNITIIDKNLLDCFDKYGYNNEVIGVYKPTTIKFFDFLQNYQNFGFQFLIYSNDKLIIDSDLDIRVEVDFRKFYRKIDLFMINSIKDYNSLIKDLAEMQEKIFIFEDE